MAIKEALLLFHFFAGFYGDRPSEYDHVLPLMDEDHVDILLNSDVDILERSYNPFHGKYCPFEGFALEREKLLVFHG